MATSAAQVARHQRRARIGWADIEPGAIAATARIETVAEGFALANFDNGVHKSRDADQFFISEGVIFTSESAGAAAAAGGAMGESINAARALINEPGNYLTPRDPRGESRGAGVGEQASPRRFSTRRRSSRSTWACCSASRAAAPSRRGCWSSSTSRRRTGEADARARRQGHHVRYRRPLDEAGRRHGADEGRHGRRRIRRGRAARDRASSNCRCA